MAKKFQTKPEKKAARERAEAHLSGKGAKAKPGSSQANGATLDLKGGEDGKAKPESIKLHFDELLKRQKGAKSGNERVRAQKALAKKDNVDTNLITKMVSWAGRDPGEVRDELKEMLRYAEVCLPDVQLDLFDEDTSSITREAQVFDDGFRAGRDARKNLKDNPHAGNTELHHCWADGYAAGQRKNASLIGKTPAKDSMGKVPGAEEATQH